MEKLRHGSKTRVMSIFVAERPHERDINNPVKRSLLLSIGRPGWCLKISPDLLRSLVVIEIGMMNEVV